MSVWSASKNTECSNCSVDMEQFVSRKAGMQHVRLWHSCIKHLGEEGAAGAAEAERAEPGGGGGA